MKKYLIPILLLLSSCTLDSPSNYKGGTIVNKYEFNIENYALVIKFKHQDKYIYKKIYTTKYEYQLYDIGDTITK